MSRHLRSYLSKFIHFSCSCNIEEWVKSFQVATHCTNTSLRFILPSITPLKPPSIPFPLQLFTILCHSSLPSYSSLPLLFSYSTHLSLLHSPSPSFNPSEPLHPLSIAVLLSFNLLFLLFFPALPFSYPPIFLSLKILHHPSILQCPSILYPSQSFKKSFHPLFFTILH